VDAKAFGCLWRNRLLSVEKVQEKVAVSLQIIMSQLETNNVGVNPKDVDGPSSSIPAPAPLTSYKTIVKDCAVLVKDAFGPIIASGPALGPGLSKVSARLSVLKAVDTDAWMGLTLEFPLGDKQTINENAGFGVRHCCGC
jgi:hypothetical protein